MSRNTDRAAEHEGERTETGERAVTRRTALRATGAALVASTGLSAVAERGRAETGCSTGGTVGVCNDGYLLASTTPGTVYAYDGSGHVEGTQVTNDEGAITEMAEHDGKLYAGVTTDPAQGYGTGQVYASGDGRDWERVGRILDGTELGENDGFQQEVTTVVEYEGTLYAGASYNKGALYEYKGDGEWETVVDTGYDTDIYHYDGFATSKIWDDKLFVGGSTYDQFGYWDGSEFHHEVDQGGSCVFSFGVHGNDAVTEDIYSGCLYGYVYKRNGGSWDRVLKFEDAGSWDWDAVYSLASHDCSMYIGSEHGGLYRWDGQSRNEAAIAESKVAQFDESVVSLQSRPDGLYVGIGQNAAQYHGGYRPDATSAVYRLSPETDSVEPVSGMNRFGSGAQVMRCTANAIQYAATTVEIDVTPTRPVDIVNCSGEVNERMAPQVGAGRAPDEIPADPGDVPADPGGGGPGGAPGEEAASEDVRGPPTGRTGPSPGRAPVAAGTDSCTIPVTIRSSNGVDPTTDIAVDTLRFGASDVVTAERGATALHAEGHRSSTVSFAGSSGNLLVHFPAQNTGITEDTEEVRLMGETEDGETIVASTGINR